MGDVIAHVIYLADVIAFINVIVVGNTLHHLYNLLMADVIAMWQMLEPLFIYVMVDVIAKWQMELPLRVGDVLGRCYNQVGRWNSHRVCLFFMLI